jgi:hypothetical protein
MRGIRRALVVAGSLWAGLSAAGGEYRLERVTLSIHQPRQEARAEVVHRGAPSVLRLRVVEPGRLVVKAGEQVLTDCFLWWGEDERLRVTSVAPDSALPLPRVVNHAAGQEEVEVDIPAELGAGSLLALTYEWEWRYRGQPALVRTWPLQPPPDEEPSASDLAFERDFPLPEPVSSEPEPADLPEEAEDEWEWVDAQDAQRPEPLDAPPGDLEAQLEADAAWARAQRLRNRLSESDRVALAEMGLHWSQFSEVADAEGRSYFDRYLALLFPPDTEPDWRFLGSEAEKLERATALRSKRWKAAQLAPGNIIGRCYFDSHGKRSSIPMRAGRMLLEESSLERAEIRVRNLPGNAGPRAVVPAPDGRVRGHGVDFSFRTAAGPFDDAETRCYWYHPGTVFIRPGDWRPGAGGGTGELAELRRSILAGALAEATPDKLEPLLGLDHDVLSLLAAGQRLKVVNTVLASPEFATTASEGAVGLLGRVVASTPVEAFAPLERRLTASVDLRTLLARNAPGLTVLGQAFTEKALGAYPLWLGPLESLPTFHLGREEQTTHLLDVLVDDVSTTLVPWEKWRPEQGVRLGAEPALPGEEAGPARRTALRFRPARQKFVKRFTSASERDGPGQALHPLELVRVELHGPQPRTRIMTAMELALLASIPDTSLIWAAAGRIGEMHIFYGGVSALTKAPALAGGAAAAAAQRAAVRTFLGRTALVAGMAAVDTYRDELSRTQEGRQFLAVHDLAMLGLATRDVYKLATSGILGEWGRRGAQVLGRLGQQAAAGLREPVESAQALARAVDRMLAEGKATVTPEGLSFSAPGGAETLRHVYFSVRAELAAQRAMAGLRTAGLGAQVAERALGTLKGLAEESQALARASVAVARRAAKLPADKAQAYLAAVESLCTSARPAARPALAALLRGSVTPGVAEPATFLKDAEWLVRHPKLAPEALSALAQKASTGKVDLGWLNSTALTADDLNFLAKDKNTPWELFKQAAQEPGNRPAQMRARARLRGIAGELVAERSTHGLFPGYRLTGRQVAVEGGTIIDFELIAADGSIRHAVEVKGWTNATWRRALEAWDAAKSDATKLDAHQRLLVKQLRGAIKQLNNAAKGSRGPPFLVCSDKLKGAARDDLRAFLDAQAPATQLKQIGEVEMVSATKRLRAAFKLPEKLPVETGGGTP